jgi:urease accessory protein
MKVAALLLSDSRFPGGGHAHSGGLEEAAARHLVTSVDTLAGFLHGRLHTAGQLAATFAAAAAHAARRGVPPSFWSRLDAELDARTPSPAQREASRAQGGATLRALGQPFRERTHQCIVLGRAIGVPADAALTAAYLSVSGPASAAVRLLGLDPLAVHRILAELADPLRDVAQRAAATAGLDPADLPAPGAPGLDLLAEAHDRKHHQEVRLFAS